MICGKRKREREREREREERERERRAAVERKRARVYPARSQPRTFHNDSNSELTLNKCVFVDSIDMSVQGLLWQAV